MILITTNTKIETVAARWKSQYYYGNKWIKTKFGDSREVYRQLKALPPGATAEMVAEIIGNRGWTDLTCSECGEHVGAVVQLGEEPDYESRTAWICFECLKKAITMLESHA